MKPLSDFFFETDVKDMGPDMVSSMILYIRLMNLLAVLSHEITKILVFSSNRSVFVLFTCHRRPPFVNLNLFTGLVYTEFFLKVFFNHYHEFSVLMNHGLDLIQNVTCLIH